MKSTLPTFTGCAPSNKSPHQSNCCWKTSDWPSGRLVDTARAIMRVVSSVASPVSVTYPPHFAESGEG